MMPLPDASIDRILVVHALETVESPSELLHEIWRILTPGRPHHRRGAEPARSLGPHGHDPVRPGPALQPLAAQKPDAPDVCSRPERWAETLYVPPLRNRFFLRSAIAWERVGVSFSLPFAGLHIVEATKQLYRAVTVRQPRRAARLAPIFIPAPAPHRLRGRRHREPDSRSVGRSAGPGRRSVLTCRPQLASVRAARRGRFEPAPAFSLLEDDAKLSRFRKAGRRTGSQGRRAAGPGENRDAVSISDDIARLEAKAATALKELYAGLTPWQKTLVARHPQRPHFVDYCRA